MKDKNIQNDYHNMSLDDLTKEADLLIKYLENHENLENETQTYQNLVKLNNLIQKEFQKDAKKINQKVKEKISKVSLKKDAN
tara:strand:- start:1214 stop:1459 length:246 start_codon:yes stop_codon:yes gene_type:complete